MASLSPLDLFHDTLIDGLDFCRMTYEFFEQVRAEPNGIVKLRERRRVEGKLLEELLPICRYVQAYYGPGRYLSIRWLNGSQPFDAQVETTGAYVNQGYWPSTATLEVTCAVHPKEYLLRERLNIKGFAFGLEGLSRVKNSEGKNTVSTEAVSYTNHSFIDTFTEILLKAIKTKAAKIYPERTTLIVDCTLNTIYMRNEWEELIRRVRTELPEHKFSEIFVSDSNGRYSAAL